MKLRETLLALAAQATEKHCPLVASIFTLSAAALGSVPKDDVEGEIEKIRFVFRGHAELAESAAKLWRRALQALGGGQPDAAELRIALLEAMGGDGQPRFASTLAGLTYWIQHHRSVDVTEERVGVELQTLVAAGFAREDSSGFALTQETLRAILNLGARRVAAKSLGMEWPWGGSSVWADDGIRWGDREETVRRRSALLLTMRAEAPWTRHKILFALEDAGFGHLGVTEDQVHGDIAALRKAGILEPVGTNGGVGISKMGWQRLLLDGVVPTVRATLERP